MQHLCPQPENINQTKDSAQPNYKICFMTVLGMNVSQFQMTLTKLNL